ncbi:MAG: LysM peptidoglycan-binding domain-containing protein [Dehalococcoidia bacterium]|nr:LysM peptidoglycan-binding domain-containing protein [Dehalococcoidia bacterium]MCB9484821.1 LysM peptidoglycan-binding domain-containing protein [Thermoflexaceae bacterium]
MNTQKQIGLMVALVFFLTAGCAAYTVIDLPVRAVDQATYQYDGSIERGALLYANNCRTCHGLRGEGFVGPALNGSIREQQGLDNWQDQDPLVLAKNKALLTRTLYCGRAGTLMPAWLDTNGGSLNVRQIEHLVNLMTQPADIETADGELVSPGWEHTVEFAHNLNGETSLVVGGDTLGIIAQSHGIGIREILGLNPSITDPEAFLEKGTRVNLPATNGAKAQVYEIKRDRENVAKINDSQFIGAMILADFNRIPYDVNFKKGTFTIGANPDLSEAGIGLYPGARLQLPAGTVYVVRHGDTVQSIADLHDVLTGPLANLNRALLTSNDIAAEIAIPEGERLVFALPEGAGYIVQGQTLDDIRRTLGGVSLDQLAEAQTPPVAGDHIYAVGTTLHTPPEAYGSTPPDATNPGTACVEHAVTAGAFETIFGGGGAPEIPSEISEDVKITSGANDWTVVADGATSDQNKGIVKIAKDAKILFENLAGFHTITINGVTEVAEFGPQAGVTFEWTFNEAGEFKITCDFHPDMLAWVYVE